MSVDANFASSLLEKVKVEDPWLRPSTWESIPSQSGPILSCSNDHDHLHCSTPSLSESSLVRLALNALQGLQSTLISIEKLAAAFCSEPADRTFHRIPNLWNRCSSTHALGNILKSIGCSGFLVFLLKKFVDHFRNLDSYSVRLIHEDKEYPPYSLVNQAFAVAVEKVLEGYMGALDTLYPSIGLRRLSKTFDGASEEGCLASGVQSKITLLEVYLHTKELRNQIEALGNICNLHNIALCFSESSTESLTANATSEFQSFWRGGDLLTYLYMQLQIADPAHLCLLKFLFLRSCEPYCGFIRSWIFKAEINDPYKEFVVEYVGSLPDDRCSKAGASINFPLTNIRERDGVSIPCFLKHFLSPLIRAGQQLQVLMKLLEFCDCVFPGEHTYMDFLPCWSGFSSNHPHYTSQMTFGKGNIETMVIARKFYYEKMQGKLESLLNKLEITYQKIASCDEAPVFLGNGGILETSFTVESNNRMAIPSAVDQRDSNVAIGGKDFDDSSMTDEFFYGRDTSESSVCSSLIGSEEQDEAEQLIENPISSFETEHKYFSALSFSMSTSNDNSLQKSLQHEKSEERDFHEISERAGAVGHFELTQNKRAVLRGISVLPESEESHFSCRDGHIDGLPDKGWPLGSLLKNPFRFDGGCRNDPELHRSVSGSKHSEENIQISEESISFSSRKIGSTYDLKVETYGENLIENGYAASHLFALPIKKLNYSGNILSVNPMLTRNSLFYPTGKPGGRGAADLGKSLSFFDFSFVEDPCKVTIEKLSVGCAQAVFEDSSLSAISAERDHKCEQVGEIVIDNSIVSCVDSHLDVKIHKNIVGANISGRSNWESLLCTSNIIENNTVEDHRQEFLAIFDIPLDFIIDKCLLQEIQLQYKYVSKLTIKFLEEGFDLHEHLLALRRYHFMELADWADLFIMSLWHHKWCIKETDHRVSEIQGILEMAVQRSSCEQDQYKSRLFVYIKEDGTLPLSTSSTGVRSFNFLGLGYQVDWPVNIVLAPRAMEIYADIFNFLIQVKLAVFSLNDVWCSLKDLMPLIYQSRHSTQHEREVGHFNLLVKLRHQVNHFVSTLEQYVHSQLSDVSWYKFLHSLKHKVEDMMDLESVHMAYLSDALNICFLSDETRVIASIIEGILQCALDFQSCLTRGMWDVEQDQGDFLGKLSRINVSQVLAIKQKFDKNLKELHLCYLKSPKHGEFGLSRFWGYLNFNDYYPDSSNGMFRYAFLG